MNISAAKFYLPESEGRKPQALGNYDKLSGPFSAAINHSEIKVPNNKALYAVNTDQYGETDALFFNPYDKTLQQRIFEKIANGVHGEALDLLFKHLDGRDPEYTRETLEYFRDEFEDRGLDASPSFSKRYSHTSFRCWI